MYNRDLDLVLSAWSLFLLELRCKKCSKSFDLLEEVIKYIKNHKGYSTATQPIINNLVYRLRNNIDIVKNGNEISLVNMVSYINNLVIESSNMGYETISESMTSLIKLILSDELNNIEKEIKILKEKIIGLISIIELDFKLKKIATDVTLNKDNYTKTKEIIEQLESIAEEYRNKYLKDTSISKQYGSMYSVTLDKDTDHKQVMTELQQNVKPKYVFKTGWQDLNKMLQGGVRTGELAIVGALGFNYKTGLTASIFASVALYNEPIKRSDKKPLLIWYSLEDDLINLFIFLYRLFKITESHEVVDVDVDEFGNQTIQDEQFQYIIDKLTATGFVIAFERLNPANIAEGSGVGGRMNVEHLISNIKGYQVNYDVQMVVVDYLAKLDTEKESMLRGLDKKIMLTKLRNFISKEDIALISPWQLSGQANDVLKADVSPTEFLEIIHDKSMYEGSSTLRTDIDLEIFCHTVHTPHNGSWLHVRRGKHKIPTTILPKDQKFFLPFPPDGAIPFDYNQTKLSRKNIDSENPLLD